MNGQPLRLGFPVKVMGKPGLKSNDTRRWQKNPHLKTSLEYVAEILDYLAGHRIRMYRLSSDLAPYATHPDMPVMPSVLAVLRLSTSSTLVGCKTGRSAGFSPLSVRAA